MNRLRLWLLAATACAGSGCLSQHVTTRVFDGREVQGPLIAEEAYAAYFTGALAEAEGRYPSALAQYTVAAQQAPNSAEVRVRIARVACKLGISRRADDEFARAYELDPKYAPLAHEQAECAALRGRFRVALNHALLAQHIAPNEFLYTESLANIYELLRDLPSARAQLAGYAVTQPQSKAAWRGLLALEQRTHSVVWSDLARQELRPQDPDDTHGVCQPDGNPATETRTRMAEYREQQQVAPALRLLKECRWGELEAAEVALDLGQPTQALSHARLVLAADPNSTEALALALLSAHRAHDETALLELMLQPRTLTPPSNQARAHIEQLLKERGWAFGTP